MDNLRRLFQDVKWGGVKLIIVTNTCTLTPSKKKFRCLLCSSNENRRVHTKWSSLRKLIDRSASWVKPD